MTGRCDLDAVEARYSRALDAKPGKGEYSPDGIAAIVDSHCDVRELVAEIRALRTQVSRPAGDPTDREIVDAIMSLDWPGVLEWGPTDAELVTAVRGLYNQPTEPAIADDFAEHYGHLPVMLAETAQILASYLTGDERGWDAEEADLDLSETIASVQQYGIVNPITLGTDGRVLDGHHRLLSARKLGIAQVPVRLAIMPTRCAPSREALAITIHRVWHRAECECVLSDLDAGEHEAVTATADAVQALCASQRTEAEVKAEALAPIHALATQIADHFGDEWPHTPACQGEPGCPLCEILWLSAGGDEQPTPAFEAMGLPTPEVPNVGGEQRG